MADGKAEGELIVVMGISGCGKSTVGQRLAELYDCPFLEGDEFHPAANVEKMSSGIPLTDEDRKDWIASICKAVRESSAERIILACSALTPGVRNALGAAPRRVTYVHLNTDKIDMKARLENRDHFMPSSLLESQRAALSVPGGALEFDASTPLPALIDKIQSRLKDQLSPVS